MTTEFLQGICFDDHRSRYVAVRPLGSYPYQAIVGLSEDDTLSAHLVSKEERRRILLACSLLIGAFSLFGFVTTAKLSLKNTEALNIRLAYRIATENGKDGFYLWKRILDTAGLIIDFKIVDCNEQGAALYKMSKKEMFGKTLVDIYGDSLYCKIVIAAGVQMDEDGDGEVEYEIPKENSIMQAKWVHIKYARTYEGLAVTIRDISDKKINDVKLDKLANNDTLTGIRNRHWMVTSLPVILEKAKNTHSTVALGGL